MTDKKVSNGIPVARAAGLGAMDLAKLRQLCAKQIELEDRLKEKEEEAAAIKQKLRLLSEDVLPQLFQDNELKTFTMNDGSVVKMSSRFYGKIEEADLEEAYAFVEEVNCGNIITNTFTITFGKDKEKAVRKFITDLGRRKIKLDWSLKRGIHTSRLCSFIKERVESALPLDFVLFNAGEKICSKIKRAEQ